MTAQRNFFTWLAIIATVLASAAVILRIVTSGGLPVPLSAVSLVGAVVRQDADPRKQEPLSNVTVTAENGSVIASGQSTSSGFFQLTIHPRVYAGRLITLRFEHPDYQPREITASVPADQLFIVRMQPRVRASQESARALAKITHIKDTRVRYLLKEQRSLNVGTLAKQFEAPNNRNVPCQDAEPCSPDRKWKATTTSLALDAEQGNEFQNVRVSCIAGPCPFTSIQSNDLTHPARKITVTVLNWSDTTNFLVEADVTRSTVTDAVRYSYPFIVEQTMNFALPAASEGPSVEANFEGQALVSPLGPALNLSWATCSVETQNGGKIYRCQLKSGYQFQ
jgi:hypothetical protein